MVSYAFGPIAALSNGLSVTSIASAASSFLLGGIISKRIIEVKNNYDGADALEIAVQAVATTVFTAAISHYLLNTFSLGTATLIQVGIGSVGLWSTGQKVFSSSKVNSISDRDGSLFLCRILMASSCAFLCNGLSLTAAIGLKYFPAMSIPEGTKSLVFATTLLATAVSVVANVAADIFGGGGEREVNTEF